MKTLIRLLLNQDLHFLIGPICILTFDRTYIYCKFGNFVRVLFSRNLAYAEFGENKIVAKWRNHSVIY